jgi:2-polyprenyl-3-methyl-5-hydroxy-6-metoxy-1,4-benzoquinol methylase
MAIEKNKFLEKVKEYEIFYKKRRFNKTKYIKKHLDFIFENVNLNGKKVLDVGGGAGLLALYAANEGAISSVCLEPELEGTTKGFRKKFEALKMDASITTHAENLNETFQSFLLKNTQKFDVVIFHNSINHLDEPACSNLLIDSNSETIYTNIFRDLYNIVEENGQIIIADCSRSNFFNDIGLKSPIVTSIEWDIHQNPETWVDMLLKSGFKLSSLKWSSHEYFGKIGDYIFGNRFFAYLTFSHFKILLKK